MAENVLKTVPAEIIVFIFKFVSYKDLCVLSQTSKDMYELSCDDIVWKIAFAQQFKRLIDLDPIEKELTELIDNQDKGMKHHFWKSKLQSYKTSTEGFSYVPEFDKKILKSAVKEQRDRSDLYRMMVWGKDGSGKSSLTIRFVHDIFSTCHMEPLIEEWYRKMIDVEGLVLTIDIWDSPEKVAKSLYELPENNFNKWAMNIIVYSVSSRESFKEVKKIIDYISHTKYFNDTDMPIPIVIIGNKIDLVDCREVSIEEGFALAKEVGASFFETSAKFSTNVKTAFKSAVMMGLYSRYTIQKGNKEKNIHPKHKCSCM